MNKTLILVVEDDRPIRNLIITTLKTHDYKYLAAENGSSAILEASSHNPDIVLLDLGLPDLEGVEVIKKIRTWSNMPIIVISARSEDADKIEALDAGADDYITKPYQAPILLARIAAVLKRTRGNTEKTSYSYENVRLDLLKCTISCDEKEVELTKNEMKILHLLFMHAGNYVARQDLIESLWDNQIFIDDNTLSVHVTRIREKLRELGRDNFIQTKRGMGYRI